MISNNFQYNYSRMLWEMENVQPTGHLSGFVDKALKLLDLKQVMMEVETSVMSKVSCTACKVGAGLLQHYIKVGKDDKQIMNSIYQFCVSLNIQSPRVCEGVTLLFGVSFYFYYIFFLLYYIFFLLYFNFIMSIKVSFNTLKLF